MNQTFLSFILCRCPGQPTIKSIFRHSGSCRDRFLYSKLVVFPTRWCQKYCVKTPSYIYIVRTDRHLHFSWYELVALPATESIAAAHSCKRRTLPYSLFFLVWVCFANALIAMILWSRKWKDQDWMLFKDLPCLPLAGIKTTYINNTTNLSLPKFNYSNSTLQIRNSLSYLFYFTPWANSFLFRLELLNQ